MNDRAISLLEQYDIEVLRTRKGRGAFIFDTKQGILLMKEYTGHPEKLRFQQRILQQVKDIGLVRAEELIPNREDQLYVKDNDEVLYIVKSSFEGSECNIYDGRECIEAMQVLAKLHVSMERACDCFFQEHDSQSPLEAGTVEVVRLPVFSPLKEYEKHNRELMRIWSYLKKKGQKQIFEIRILGVIEYFVNQARKVTEDWRELEVLAADVTETAIARAVEPVDVAVYGDVTLRGNGADSRKRIPAVCHGDYQYHNVIRTQDGWCVLNFEKMLMDNPIRDVYLFMRKVMEKNNWSVSLGKEMLSAYEVIRVLEEHDKQDLYHRFSYPEKFWKIANFYYNSGKAWIPEKNLEKLEKVISQEQEKQVFLREVFKA